MTSSRIHDTENEIVENFLREQREESSAYSNSINHTNEINEATLDGNDRGFSSCNDETSLTEDIRKIARALAPQLSELEDVLKDFTDTETADALDQFMNHTSSNANDISRSLMEEEDDDLDDEITQLATSEQALREELEFAAGISMLGSPSPSLRKNAVDPTISAINLPSPLDLRSRLEAEQHPEKPSYTIVEDCKTDMPSKYTLQDHANYLQLKTEATGSWYYIEMTSNMLPAAVVGSASRSITETEDLVKDYCLPIPFRKLKRLYGGLVFYDCWEDKQQEAIHQMSTTTQTKPPSKKFLGASPVFNRLLQTPSKCNKKQSTTQSSIATTTGFTVEVPVTPATPANSKAPVSTNKQKAPTTPLQPIKNSNFDSNMNIEEPLPVRTIAIRVRPDVLCGAIMDAAYHAFEILPSECTTHFIKRQGGHLRGAVYVPKSQLAYVVDVQLCTQKSDTLERRLLLRFYHIQDDPDALHELGQILHRRKQHESENQSYPTTNGNGINVDVSCYSSRALDGEVDDAMMRDKSIANRHMKQACSLIQRLMAAEKQKGGIKNMDHEQQSSWLGLKNAPFDSKVEMQRAIGTHLESNYKSCPSVREENKKASPTIRRLTLPSLSKRDWPMLDASWTLTSHIVEELDTRDCSFNTLTTLPFGQFPSLPTLDVQYCSQLRRLSRENMIAHLLKSAKELEQYANLAEYNCAVFITLLGHMTERYMVPPLSLPTPKVLEEYPLDYTSPQTICPPWGGLVMEALNIVAAKTPTGEISVEESVPMVYQAFVKQDDEEKGARLGRKNAQIMERLANMQSHQRAMVQNIGDSHVYNETAANAASQFLEHCKEALNKGKVGYPSTLAKEVPIFDVKISLGASRSGRCIVTAKQILFVTSYIPLVGSTSSMVFDLNLIHFQIEANSAATFTNPFPNTVNVILNTSNEKVFSFRPAMGPARLQTFMTIIQTFAREDRPAEFSQVFKDDDEGMLRLSESQSEEEQELSV
mmetsp:Transcript_8793/g.21469  ORF Transcript_8793/g.21469 Transcript_8793/m.21469 type:complete len:987 (-) Transcript_8793:33-2993(-)|eukprot:CAMPEP_0197193120 /NCGR_PEP_ID=MMETSP1423-20130617/26494_1 /TAXON_ID=476441 /ORGANISM="Pseudo-nitzschia heimii, Strain UNC1101" /LENGTH=986 /DNA_ID=CAMNT_0042646205 /DNA_START=85 /DNA_END=3045 /DNA_ORIENTATION=+